MLAVSWALLGSYSVCIGRFGTRYSGISGGVSEDENRLLMKSAPVGASLLCPFGQRRTHPPGASLGHWRDHPGARLSFLTVWEVSAQLILNFPTVHQHPPASYPSPPPATTTAMPVPSVLVPQDLPMTLRKKLSVRTLSVKIRSKL